MKTVKLICRELVYSKEDQSRIECGFKTWRKWKSRFTDADLTCPKCQTYGSLEEK